MWLPGYLYNVGQLLDSGSCNISNLSVYTKVYILEDLNITTVGQQIYIRATDWRFIKWSRNLNRIDTNYITNYHTWETLITWLDQTPQGPSILWDKNPVSQKNILMSLMNFKTLGNKGAGKIGNM